jgi:hypothetical protein
MVRAAISNQVSAFLLSRTMGLERNELEVPLLLASSRPVGTTKSAGS